MSTLTIIFNNKMRLFDVMGESIIRSDMTKRELIKLSVGINAKGKANHIMIQELIVEGKRNGLEGKYTKDNVLRRWKIIHSSYISDPLETYFTHTLALIEMEGG